MKPTPNTLQVDTAFTLPDFVIKCVYDCYSVALKIVKNDFDANDILQESILKLITYGNKYSSLPEAEWKNITKRCVYNCSIDFYRLKKRQRKKVVYYEKELNIADQPRFDHKLIDQEKQRYLYHVMNIIESIPKEEDRNMIKEYMSGKKYNEIAKVKGITTSAVAGRIRNARIYIYKILKKKRMLCGSYNLALELNI